MFPDILSREKEGLTSNCTGRGKTARHAGEHRVEPVEKVPKHIFGGDVEKSDLIECTTINDLMLGKGQATPEISVKTAKVTFSTGSLSAQCGQGKETAKKLHQPRLTSSQQSI